uniref:Apolipoprotein B mRNA editing enzyme catalytic polypeptide like 4 n=1 Tax=Salvator merianae TaxID=96440 RepID=A0A8D0C1R6_SALMN
MESKPETFCQEYLAPKGTVVKPYYWLTMSQNCTNCPYHIQTGEEARISYVEFHKAFGFPYGSIHHQNKHLLFYELRQLSGELIQKGHATHCSEYNIHPESMLFEKGGYLDAIVHDCGTAAYIIIYSNYSPCNEAEHGCISKMYSFLMKNQDVTLCIYCSQLYHTEADFPGARWNCEALQSLASMWPQVTLSPLCGRLWHYFLYNFVTTRPLASLYSPILPVRALADRQNAQEISSVTGVKLPFPKILSQPIHGNLAAIPNFQKFYFPTALPQHSGQMITDRLPPLRISLPGSKLPIDVSSSFGKQLLYPKPKNIVRHLKMPDKSSSKAKSSYSFQTEDQIMWKELLSDFQRSHLQSTHEYHIKGLNSPQQKI